MGVEGLSDFRAANLSSSAAASVLREEGDEEGLDSDDTSPEIGTIRKLETAPSPWKRPTSGTRNIMFSHWKRKLGTGREVWKSLFIRVSRDTKRANVYTIRTSLHHNITVHAQYLLNDRSM